MTLSGFTHDKYPRAAPLVISVPPPKTHFLMWHEASLPLASMFYHFLVLQTTFKTSCKGCWSVWSQHCADISHRDTWCWPTVAGEHQGGCLELWSQLTWKYVTPPHTTHKHTHIHLFLFITHLWPLQAVFVSADLIWTLRTRELLEYMKWHDVIHGQMLTFSSLSLLFFFLLHLCSFFSLSQSLRARLEELRMFLENETWELCPVKSNFNIAQLHVSKNHITEARKWSTVAFIYSTLSLFAHPHHCDICIRIWSTGDSTQCFLCMHCVQYVGVFVYVRASVPDCVSKGCCPLWRICEMIFISHTHEPNVDHVQHHQNKAVISWIYTVL